jgi:trans-aconitate 2-methyltransferase
MPNNFSAPTHQHIKDTVLSGPWKSHLKKKLRLNPVSDVATYYDLLSPLSSDIDIWETIYTHILTGSNPIVEWTRGSALRPLLDYLSETDQVKFLKIYSDLVQESYPKSKDGKTLMKFRRLFVLIKIDKA